MSNQTRNTARSATEKSGLDEAKEAGQELRDSVKGEARKLGEAAKQHATERAEQAKEDLADQVSSVGNAFRRASDDLRSGSPQEQVFGHAANSIADLADGIRGKDFSTIIDDVSDLARRNPLAFLGGAALLGFAGARLARASQKRPRNGDSDNVEAAQSGTYSPPSASASHLDRGVAGPRSVTPANPTTNQRRNHVG